MAADAQRLRITTGICGETRLAYGPILVQLFSCTQIQLSKITYLLT
jgi:hypothetical protein